MIVVTGAAGLIGSAVARELNHRGREDLLLVDHLGTDEKWGCLRSLAFEDYLHRSRRLPTRLGFPDLLPSPSKWHDWSWGQLRAPVYVVPKHPEEIEAVVGAGSPHPSRGDAVPGVLQPEAQNLSDPLSKTP